MKSKNIAHHFQTLQQKRHCFFQKVQGILKVRFFQTQIHPPSIRFEEKSSKLFI